MSILCHQFFEDILVSCNQGIIRTLPKDMILRDAVEKVLAFDWRHVLLRLASMQDIMLHL